MYSNCESATMISRHSSYQTTLQTSLGGEVREMHSGMCVCDEMRRLWRCGMSFGASSWCISANAHMQQSARNNLSHINRAGYDVLLAVAQGL